MKKRALKLAVAAGAGLVLVAAGTWWYVSRAGQSELESWIRHYLTAAIQQHLNGRIELAELDYQFPRTVVIVGLRLSSDGQTLLSIDRLRLELAKMPRRGEPVVVQDIDATRPTFRLATDAAGAVLGWTSLLRSETGDAPAPPQPEAEAGFRLSDFLRIRRMAIRDGVFEYAAAGATSPMTLDKIGAELKTPPRADDPGWYRVVGSIARDELAGILIDADVNLDDGEILLKQLRLTGELGPSRYRIFPPGVQDWLREHDVAGRLLVEVTGSLSAFEFGRRDLAIRATLDDARFRAGEAPIPVVHARLDAGIAGEDVKATIEAQAFDGEIRLDGGFALSPRATGRLEARFDALDAASIFAALPASIRQGTRLKTLAGRLSGTGRYASATDESATWELSAKGVLRGLRADAEPLRVASEAVEVSAEMRNSTILRCSTEGLRLDVKSAVVQTGRVELEVYRAGADTQCQATAEVWGGRARVKLDAGDGANGDRMGMYAELQEMPLAGPLALVRAIADGAAPAGEIDATFTGDVRYQVPTADGAPSRVEANGKLRGGFVQIGTLPRIPFRESEIRLTRDERGMTCDVRARLMGGSLDAWGQVLPGERGDVRVKWAADALRLEELSAALKPESAGRYRGALSSTGSLTADSANWQDTVEGQGSLEVKQGKLLRLPVVGELIQLVDNRILSLALNDDDHAIARFELRPGRFECKHVEVGSALLALRGHGAVGFDRSLNLDVRVDALPRLTKLLGPIGGLLRDVGDRVVLYEVTGTIDAPRFELRPLGLGAAP